MPEARSLLQLQRADLIVPTVTPWLIQDWLVENTLAGLVAASGSCKSFVAIDWACCIATGTPWHGHAVKRGPVVYLAGEGQHGLRKRIAAWEHFHRQSIAGAPLFLSAGLPSLCNDPNAVASIEEMNAATLAGPSFVVVDTVARAMGGANENSAEDMSWLIRTMDWIRAECLGTVLSIHHTGNSPTEQGRARGSSAYRAALDSEFLIKPISADEIELSTSKSKDWLPAEAMRLRKRVVPIDIGEATESSLVLDCIGRVQTEVDKRPQVFELRESGLSERAIASQTGLGKSTVHRLLAGSAPPRPIYTDRGGGAGMDRGANDAGQARGNGAADYTRASEGDR